MKQLFQQVDPMILDQYAWSKKDLLRRRPMPLETTKYLSLLRRALQALPPRELQFVYLQKAKKLVQEETRKIYSVQQQNISYRLTRASQRIALHYKIMTLVSETQLRRRLLDLGLSSHLIRIITGIVRTSSQAATAKALAVSPGSIRYSYAKALTAVETHDQEQSILKVSATLSETQIRRQLFNSGFTHDQAMVVTGVVVTFSQEETAEAYRVDIAHVRSLVSRALPVLGFPEWESAELRLLSLMARNLNQLRCTESQERWAWKKNRAGGGDRPWDGQESSLALLLA